MKQVKRQEKTAGRKEGRVRCGKQDDAQRTFRLDTLYKLELQEKQNQQKHAFAQQQHFQKKQTARIKERTVKKEVNFLKFQASKMSSASSKREGRAYAHAAQKKKELRKRKFVKNYFWLRLGVCVCVWVKAYYVHFRPTANERKWIVERASECTSDLNEWKTSLQVSEMKLNEIIVQHMHTHAYTNTYIYA